MTSINTYIITESQRLYFKPTYLYIKRHSITGLQYFGKTTKHDPIKYLGSGTYWKNHINKHGKEYIITDWYKLFTDIDELIEYAIDFSISNNIVKSENWANLCLETGIGGGTPSTIFTEERIEKQKNSLKIYQENVLKEVKEKQYAKRAATMKLKSEEELVLIYKSIGRSGPLNPMYGKSRPDLAINAKNPIFRKKQIETRKLNDLIKKLKRFQVSSELELYTKIINVLSDNKYYTKQGTVNFNKICIFFPEYNGSKQATSAALSRFYNYYILKNSEISSDLDINY